MAGITATKLSPQPTQSEPTSIREGASVTQQDLQWDPGEGERLSTSKQVMMEHCNQDIYHCISLSSYKQLHEVVNWERGAVV